MRPTLSVQKFLLGVFDDEERMLEAVKGLRRAGIPIHDVFTPYAVHGLDEAMGLKRSRLPIVCFLAGGFGLLFGLLFQSWVFTSDWPMNFGGKPFFAVPAFVPVTFEMTVLIGGLVTVAAFLFRSHLIPGAVLSLIDPAVTNDRFVVALSRADASLDAVAAEKLFRDVGAELVREGEVLS